MQAAELFSGATTVRNKKPRNTSRCVWYDRFRHRLSERKQQRQQQHNSTDLTMKRLMALSLGMALAVDAHLIPKKQNRTAPAKDRGRGGVQHLDAHCYEYHHRSYTCSRGPSLRYLKEGRQMENYTLNINTVHRTKNRLRLNCVDLWRTFRLLRRSHCFLPFFEFSTEQDNV